MADSGEQPTADAEVDTLVNAIFEMLMEIDESKINISSQRLYLDKLLHDLRSNQSQEVSAARLRKFMSMLQNIVQKHSNAINAAEADKPNSSAATSATSAPTAATGNTRDHRRAEQPGGDCRLDITDARRCVVRGDTKAKCEAFRAFGLVYIREKLAAGGAAAKVTQKELCEAYAKSISVETKTIDWLLRAQYLDFDALQKAAVANDASMCPIGGSRVAYDTIEAFLEAESGTESAHNVRIAADWCVAQLDVIPRQTSDGRQKDTLVQLWAEQRPTHSCSLKSLFKNGPFSMQKLRHYAQRAIMPVFSMSASRSCIGFLGPVGPFFFG